MEKNYWAIHMGRNSMYTKFAHDNNFIAIGWTETKINLVNYQGLESREFNEKINPILEKTYSDMNVNSRGQTMGQLYRFSNLMKIGDIVLMPYSPEGKVNIGIVESDLYFKSKDKDECPYEHRRDVKWLKTINLSELSQELKNSIGSIMTVFNISRHVQEIESLLSGETISVKGDIEDLEDFGLESHLEEFIVENWNKLDLGKKYSILKEDKEVVGQQYITSIGRIDILAKSKDEKEWLVIELKKGKNSDQVVGQILRYITWIKENEAKGNEKVRGLIITREHDDKLKYAIRATENIELMTYSVDFKLHKI